MTDEERYLVRSPYLPGLDSVRAVVLLTAPERVPYWQWLAGQAYMWLRGVVPMCLAEYHNDDIDLATGLRRRP